MKKIDYTLNSELLQDFINISSGLFSPLNGFLTYKDYYLVINKMMLNDGTIWTIPITLDIPQEIFESINQYEIINLLYDGKEIGYLEIEDVFTTDMENFKKVFNTSDLNHPGLLKESQRWKYRVGGKTTITDETLFKYSLMPSKIKSIFAEKGWNSTVGFQTRNPIHKAHEYLQRIGLEVCDGLFINPLTGWKKEGDFTDEAILTAYNLMLREYYPSERVYFAELKTPMRYAGPREAIFHALIRKNLGCTHFIIGRDHAGIGNYYGSYEAHDLARKLSQEHNLGIDLLLLMEPYYCIGCGQVVSAKTCRHGSKDIVKISGTKIRAMLNNGEEVDERLMRKDIAEAIKSLNTKIFI